MKLKDLIKKLVEDKQHFHDKEVEYIICTQPEGEIVTMAIEGSAADMSKALSLFGTKEKNVKIKVHQ
jgi:hypothetical protein